MNTALPFSTDFKTTPYWWDAMTPWEAPARPLPDHTDVVIVGAGLTGSSAAATLARAGMSVLMLDTQYPGYGASARNAGFLSRHFKHSLGDLLKKLGLEEAISHFRALQDAYDFTISLIKTENLDCNFQEHGRFIAAMDEPGFNRLKQEYALRKTHLNEAFTIMEEGGATEYRSDCVVGGILLKDQASIHPGLYVQSIAQRALMSGAELFTHTAVTGIAGSTAQGFNISTTRGSVRCRNVIIATNGYSDKGVNWVRRSLIPIRGYQIATEALPDGLLKEILPHSRTYTDRRKASNYLRPSPDGTRLLFGGRTGALMEDNIQIVALQVRNEMVRMFPQLRNVQLSHAWSGRCAATIDMFPRLGVRNGVYYALAYCFSGNVLAPYFGHHIALKILGKPMPRLPFEARRFGPIPFYTGNAWFVPIVQKYYELLDRVGRS